MHNMASRHRSALTVRISTNVSKPLDHVGKRRRAVWGVRQKFAGTFMQRQVWPAADIKMHLPRSNVPLADIELLMCAFNRC
jgi:hypothetical protein